MDEGAAGHEGSGETVAPRHARLVQQREEQRAPQCLKQEPPGTGPRAHADTWEAGGGQMKRLAKKQEWDIGCTATD